MTLEKKTISELPYILDPLTNLKILVDTGSTRSYVNSAIAERFFSAKMQEEPFTVKTAHGCSRGRFTTLVPCGKLFGIKNLKLKFNVFNFHPKFDLLLGLDNIKIMKAQICFKKNVFITPYTELPVFYLGKECAEINLIEPRCIQQIKIRVKNVNNGEAIMPYHRVGNLEIPESLIKVRDNTAFVRVLNPNEVTYKFSQILPVAVEEIPDLPNVEDAPNLNNYINDNLNFNFNVNDLRINHMDEIEKSYISKLVEEFSDVFSLGNDPLTFAHGIKHEIKTRDEVPIYSRNYRFPQIYREEIDRQVQEMLDQGICVHSQSPYNAPIFLVPKKTPPGAPADTKPRFRLVVDYRGLNAVTLDDRYPLPQISELLDKLGRCQYFSVIDLKSGFWQVEMDPESQAKTAFSTPTYHLEFKRMPFGLKNAPSTFQRLMDNILRGVANEYCCVYMDDIIVFSVSLEEHMVRLRAIFTRLRNANLKVQLEKCDFLRKEVTYLGHVITNEGVKPNPEKIKCILSYPIPSTTTQIKSFLGLLGYYRRFIKNFSDITKPMTQCLKKGGKIDVNNPEYRACFEKCKTLLTNDPILQYPDFTKEFRLTTDASNVAVGCVLSQMKDGHDLPIAYASRTLNEHERRLSTIEKELLAVYWGIHYFRPYLFGRKFKVYSDHQPLQWLNSIKEPSSKLFKWKTKLSAYDFEIIYKKGSANSNADALSRVEILNNSEEESPFSEALLEQALDDFFSTLTPNTKEVIANLPLVENPTSDSIAVEMSDPGSNPDDTFSPDAVGNQRVAIPTKEEPINKCKQQIIVQLVKMPLDKPVKIENTFQNKSRITVRIPKTNTDQEIVNFIKEYIRPKSKYGIYFEQDLHDKFCEVLNKMFTHSEISLTRYTKRVKDVVQEPEQSKIIKDYHEGFMNHRGIQETYLHLQREYYWPDMRQSIQKFVNNCPICVRAKYDRAPLKLKYNVTPTASRPLETLFIDIITLEKVKFLSIIDSFSRFAQLYPLKSSNAVDIVEALVTHCTHHAVPAAISLDNAPEFHSSMMREFALTHNINLHYTSSQRPESQGIVERFHSTLIEHMRVLNERNEFKRETVQSKVLHALLSYNNSVHSALGSFTPFELLYGHTTQHTLLDLTVDQALANNYLSRHKEKMSAVYALTREQMHARKAKVIEKLNEDREDLPPIPDKIHVKTVQKQSKTKPQYNEETIKSINAELKTAEIVPRHHNTKPKIHLANVRRPKKFVKIDTSSAWNDNLDPRETLQEKYGYIVKREDLLTLRDKEWVNDIVINFYLKLLESKCVESNGPQTFCFDTYMFPSLVSGGYNLVKGRTKRIDLFNQEIVIIPIHETSHWRLIIVEPKLKRVTYLDSLNCDGSKILAQIKSYLQKEHLTRKKEELKVGEWEFRQDKNVPQQLSTHECGIFLLQFARNMAAGEPIAVDPHNIPFLRERICSEILTTNLI